MIPEDLAAPILQGTDDDLFWICFYDTTGSSVLTIEPLERV